MKGGVDTTAPGGARRRWICTNVDSPTIGFIAEVMQPEGGTAGVIALVGEAEYRRGLAGGAVKRLWLRFQMYVGYALRLMWRVLRSERGSTHVVTTNCFFAPLLASIVGRWRGVAVIHLLFDLYPDGLEVGRKIAVNGLAARALGLIPRKTQTRQAGVVYLGETLRRHVEARWGAHPVWACIDVGTDETLFPASPPRWEGGTLRVRYGGQLGYFHDAELVGRCVRAACMAQAPGPGEGGVEFVFYASGAGARFLRRALADLPVKVELPVEAGWREDLVRHPVGLVSLSPRGATVCLPSKAYGMLAGSQAVLAICPAWSDLARIVTEHDCGWVVENSPYRTFDELAGPEYLRRIGEARDPSKVEADFVEVLRRIAADPEEVERKRRNARHAAERVFGRAAIGARWGSFLNRVEGSTP